MPPVEVFLTRPVWIHAVLHFIFCVWCISHGEDADPGLMGLDCADWPAGVGSHGRCDRRRVDSAVREGEGKSEELGISEGLVCPIDSSPLHLSTHPFTVYCPPFSLRRFSQTPLTPAKAKPVIAVGSGTAADSWGIKPWSSSAVALKAKR